MAGLRGVLRGACWSCWRGCRSSVELGLALEVEAEVGLW